MERAGHETGGDDDEARAGEELEEDELLRGAEAGVQGSDVGLVGEDEVELEDPGQGVGAHAFALVAAQDPAGQAVEEVDGEDPAVDVDYRLQVVVREGAEVDLGVGFSYHVREESDREGEAEPHEADEGGGEPAAGREGDGVVGEDGGVVVVDGVVWVEGGRV